MATTPFKRKEWIAQEKLGWVVSRIECCLNIKSCVQAAFNKQSIKGACLGLADRALKWADRPKSHCVAVETRQLDVIYVGQICAFASVGAQTRVWRMKMKKFLLTGIASIALLGAAQAADLPSTQEPAFAPVPEAQPAFNWTGFYGGLNLGYSFGEFNGDATASLFDDASGFVGGIQAGYNYQFGSIVAGVEADWQITNFSDTVGATEASIENFGTVRGRLGFAADRFMPYVTGGYAFANSDVTGLGGEMHHGWALGAGVEYAWTDNITTKLEGIYTSFGEEVIGGAVDAGADIFTIRTGLNFKF
jgi:outer membrane immunogenic protein